VKAFTLAEILIAMVISGILLALAVKVIQVFANIGTDQDEASSNNNKIFIIQTALKENFTNSSRIETEYPDQLTFIYPDRSPTLISFSSAGIVIKSQLSSDTIAISYDSLQITRLDSTSTLVKRLSFVIQSNNSTYPVFFRKDYVNQILYNIDRNAN
jgi:prepilin-type N-terminal cleavage/methylation domain-containing protein